jgi:hypothetical protein
MKFGMLILFVLFSIDSDASVVRNLHSELARLLGREDTIEDLARIESLGLEKGESGGQPWSGSFWPDILGGIANHYRDHAKLPAALRFVLRYDIAILQVHEDHAEVRRGLGSFSEEELNRKLSPTEKYDLLFGDLDFSFTRSVLEDIDFRAHHLKRSKMKPGAGRRRELEGVRNPSPYADLPESYSRFDAEVEYRYWQKRRDSVSYWFGICDGWSPASIHLPRPVNPVTIRGALGHRITFFPDDLKALGSYLFARTNTEGFSSLDYRFSGRPCSEWGAPSRDRAGYVRDFRCDDVDAGLFHTLLVNRIGIERTGFMLDIDNNHKINNHPVGRYRFRYFNPETGQTGSLEASRVSLNAIRDPYRARRNPEARQLVGVRTEIDYRFYQWPEENRERISDDESFDRVETAEFEYDLELDSDGRILGGEWNDRSRRSPPDFLWLAPLNSLPFSAQSTFAIGGHRIEPSVRTLFGNFSWAWDGESGLPGDWLRAAREDAKWSAPVVGHLVGRRRRDREVFPTEARDPVLKPAQPLSHLVYFLFDRARAIP